jgi:hypothetical protein
MTSSRSCDAWTKKMTSELARRQSTPNFCSYGAQGDTHTILRSSIFYCRRVEVGEMLFELGGVVVMLALTGRVHDSSAHLFDLAVGTTLRRFERPMLNVEIGAGCLEGVAAFRQRMSTACHLKTEYSRPLSTPGS